jgi:Xaa-Pro dipeptidase
LEVVEGNFFVERVRLVLSPTEISYVEKAAVYTQRGVEAATGAAQSPGATDSSIAAAIRAALAEEANSSAAIDPIVATGPRAGISHSTWNCTPVEKGTTTFVEFAGACHRYHAPVMRTLTHGKPSAIAMRLEELARTTIVTVLDIAQPGVPCTEVARQALDAIGPLEDDIAFHYNFGYPVGLAHPPGWMDGAPFYLVSGNQEPLKEGMVFHLPASFRWFGTVGVGLSQTFVVEAEGARVLTRGPAEVVQV